MIKLWDHEHPYYMNEGCFFKSGCLSQYKTWKEYLEDWKDSDEDLNLLFRWDFSQPDEDNKNEPRSLDIFYVLQRKAYTFSCHIAEIKEKELPEIEAFLRKKSKRIAKIWSPFLKGAK